MNRKSKPVLIICFNRPDNVEILINALRLYKPEKIYISQDAPRLEKENDQYLCDQVREKFKLIDWTSDVSIRLHKKNQGCRNGVLTAIDWLFEENESGIILEDDCVPQNGFFEFINFCLVEYAEEKKVAGITGTNILGSYPFNYSHGFSFYGHVWGWGTWKDRWEDFRSTSKMEIESYLKGSKFKKLKIYNIFLGLRWRRNFALEKRGEISAWDIDWMIYKWRSGLLTIVPEKNLIINNGFGDNATNTKKQTNSRSQAVQKIEGGSPNKLVKQCPEGNIEFDFLVHKEFNSDLKSFVTSIIKKILRLLSINK